MSTYNKLINNLESLKLTAMVQNLDYLTNQVNQNKVDFISGLYELTKYQIEAQQHKEIAWCIQWGAFPFRKTFDDFDFGFQPSINKEQILDLKTLRFMEHQENILFIGSPGVGKTHLAIAIGIHAATQKKQVVISTVTIYFYS